MIILDQSDKILSAISKYCKSVRSLIWYYWVFQIFHPRCNRLSCVRKFFNTCNIVDGLFFINCCLLEDVITNISIHRRLLKLGYCKIWRRWFHKHVCRECQICNVVDTICMNKLLRSRDYIEVILYNRDIMKFFNGWYLLYSIWRMWGYHKLKLRNMEASKDRFCLNYSSHHNRV